MPCDEPDVSVVVPTYNEAQNIEDLIGKLHDVLNEASISHEIIIIDDDSPDGTYDTAAAVARTDESVVAIRRTDKKGRASAVLDGFRSASGRSLAVVDGDLQHDETVLPQMTQQVLSGDCDICVGSRAELGGFGHVDKSRSRLTRYGTVAVKVMLPVLRNSPDPLSEFYVLSRAAYNRSPASQIHSPSGYRTSWFFTVLDRTVRPAYVEYDFRPRAKGEPKMSAKVMAADLRGALSLMLRRLRRRPASQKGVAPPTPVRTVP